VLDAEAPNARESAIKIGVGQKSNRNFWIVKLYRTFTKNGSDGCRVAATTNPIGSPYIALVDFPKDVVVVRLCWVESQHPTDPLADRLKSSSIAYDSHGRATSRQYHSGT
jgi:hypothetical protein